MIDVMTLLYLAGLTFGLIAADSYFLADNARIEVNVHPWAAGFTQPVVADYFDHELRRTFDTESLMRVPQLRLQSDQSFVSLLSRAAGVEPVQHAVQQLLRLDPMTIQLVVHAATKPGETVMLQAYGRRSSGDAFDVRVAAVPGDVPASVRAIAGATARAIDPYHAALRELRGILEAGALQRARLRTFLADHLALHARARQPRDPAWAPHLNLAGVVHFHLGELDAAAGAFEAALRTDPRLATPRINLAATRLALGDAAGAAEAVRLAAQAGAEAERQQVSSPGVRTTLRMAARVTAAATARRTAREGEPRRIWSTICAEAPAAVSLSVGMLYLDSRWGPGEAIPACNALVADGTGTVNAKSVTDLAAELVLFAPLRDGLVD